MNTAIRGKTPAIREKRLNAIGAYFGTVGGALHELYDGRLAQRVRTFSQDKDSDILYALQAIGTIRGAGIVIHGPRGCGILPNAPLRLAEGARSVAAGGGVVTAVPDAPVRLAE
ncbi:MAG: hypothetical protein LBR77_06240, partial [Lachnospiraceae bacterium]|nr:hypothetical protein [Lachnospiraceae bacterium]